MDKNLARTLTTALVQFIDRERPEGTMCCSSYECEKIEKAFEGGTYDVVENLIKRKLSGLTEFESTFLEHVFNQKPEDLDEENREIFLEDARFVFNLAREQLIKDGYIIEKKAFYDAVAKVDPKVMKEVSDNVDKENELAKKYLEGYTQGYKDAEKFYNDFVAYRTSEPVLPGVAYKSPRITDVLITPNTTCGTSTGTLHDNTSVTDGKEHNPSFTD